jgi:hypothetical protein
VVQIFSTPVTKQILLLLFNQCFLSGSCPPEWSHSELFIIYKGKGDPSDPNNYRAINLLDEFYRIYSRLLYKRLASWAARYNFFSTSQFGFRSGSGTIEAAFSLQTIIRSWIVKSGGPVFRVFIDIKKAFPSVDRVRLVGLLHRLGLPGPMTRAIASTYAFNTCCLKIGSFLSSTFPVNLGVREGDIESPPLFNIVYGEILFQSGLGFLDESVFDCDNEKVAGVAYADDLATLGLRVDPIEMKMVKLAECMLPFNLRINGGKTVLLIFVPSRRAVECSFMPANPNLFFDGQWIQKVVDFKYLGVNIDFLASSVRHEAICLARAKTAAVQIGKICRQLGMVDFSRLRTYFFSFVVSQFHASQLVLFSDEAYEEVLSIFFRSCFTLPLGFPRAIFYFLLGANEFRAQQVAVRRRFFRRCTQNAGFMRSVMCEDRSLFLLGQDSWNSDFQVLYESLFPRRRFAEIDLFSENENHAVELARESNTLREARLFMMPSGVLFRTLLPYQVFPGFLAELSRRSFEEVRLVLIFLANMFSYCFFSRTTESCPLCQSEFSSLHFFNCPFAQSHIRFELQVPDWRALCRGREWNEFIDLFFVVALFWTRSVNTVRAGHTATIQKGVRLFLV